MTRTAIITGAAQGVGEATAHQLASQGFGRFLLIDRLEARLAQAADRLRATGAEVHQMVTDLADIAATRAALAPHLTALGTVDALINAAGSTARGGIKDATVPVFDLLFAVNVRAPFFLIQDVAPHMPRGGVIVNVASMLAHGGRPFWRLMPPRRRTGDADQGRREHAEGRRPARAGDQSGLDGDPQRA